MKKAEVKKGKKKNVLKEYWPLYLMMLPALLYLLINNYIPMAGMVIAFKKLNFAKGIWASPWAGLKNFKFLFASKDAWIITRNTLLYNVAFILVNMVVGIAIAILITEVKNIKLKVGNVLCTLHIIHVGMQKIEMIYLKNCHLIIQQLLIYSIIKQM